MSGVSFSDTLRAAQLDGALAFSTVFTETQELISGSAIAGVGGLLQAIEENSAIQNAYAALDQSNAAWNTAIEYEENNHFSAADAATVQSTQDAVDAALQDQAAPLVSTANSAVTAANGASDGSSAATAVKNAAAKNLQAAQALASGDSDTGRTLADQAVSQANSALSAAESHVASLQSQLSSVQGQISSIESTPGFPASVQANPAAWALYQSLLTTRTSLQQDISEAQNVLVAAEQVKSAALETRALAYSPIAIIDGETPTVYDLENGYTVATWGDTGYWTLIDENGEGIIVSPDGQVDPLNGDGEGWQFSNTSTFVLGDETKITVTPGSGGASVSIYRGDEMLLLEDLASGTVPSVTGPDKGGRVTDQEQNDGHIFMIGGDASSWTNGGLTLGDEAGREQVATTDIENELALDPTDVAIPDELRTFLEENGFDFTLYDLDGDGKMNATELSAATLFVVQLVSSFSDTYQSILDATAEGVEALFELNLFLENLLKEVNDEQEERERLNAEETALLDQLLQRLESAFETLNSGEFQLSGPSSLSAILSGLSELQVDTAGPSLPPELSAIIGQIQTGAPPDEVTSQIISALESLGIGPAQGDPDFLAAQIENRLTSIAEGNIPSGQLGFVVGELGVLLARAAGAGSLSSAGQGAITQEIQALLESRLGGVLPAGELNDLVQKIAGEVAGAAASGEISLGALAESIAGLLGGVATEGGLTGDAITTLSRQIAAFLPQLLTAGALPSGGLLAFVQALVTAVSKGPEGTETGGDTSGVDSGSGSAFRRAAKLLSGFGQTLNQEILSQFEGQTGTVDETGSATDTGQEPGGFFGSFFGGPTTSTQSESLFSQFISSLGDEEASKTGLLASILANFATDPELRAKLEQYQSDTMKLQEDLLRQAENVYARAETTLKQFFELITSNDLISKAIFTEDMAEADYDMFMEKMNALYHNWGLDWGDTDTDLKDPQVEAQIVNKAVQSGTMI